MKKLTKSQCFSISGGLRDSLNDIADGLKAKGQLSDECAFILPILWRVHIVHGISWLNNPDAAIEVRKAGCDGVGFVNYLNALVELS